MHPRDRDPAFGICVGVALSAPLFAGIAALVAWLGEPALRYVAMLALIIREYVG